MKNPPKPHANDPTKIVLVDDHAMFRKGLRLLLEQEAGLCVVAEAGDGQSAIDQVREWSPDIVVMDVTMPKANGIEATRRIVAEFPKTRVVALSVHGGRQFVEDMLQAGAVGYILKESAPEELVKGIETVARGEIYLSPAITRVVVSQFKKNLSGGGPDAPSSSLSSGDTEFLKLIAEGKSPKQIGRALRIKPDTVRARQQQIKARIGVENDDELLAYAESSGDESSQRTERGGGRTAGGVLQTKLHAPALDPELVSRPRLLEKLNGDSRRPLTLVSAPAGYGKSTLVAQWFASLKTRSAWLSLSEEDNDLRLFLSYLVAAIQTGLPTACGETARLLEALELPSASGLADALGNDLDALHHPLVLALDDYHHIRNSEIQDLLNELLRHPPRQMQFVVITRRDPPLALPSLRARGHLTEIGLDDLRFSAPETRVVLKQRAGVTLSEVGWARLDKEMEGWIAGLHLLGLVLRNRKDHEAYLSHLSGGIQHVNEYLVQEILTQQSEAMQECLLRTAVLERFCAPLCDAISPGSNDAATPWMRGSEFVQTLQESNLFAIALDPRGEWFRYHHLFQHLLRQQLERRVGKDQISRIHLKAAGWLEAEGFVDEAIDHAFASGVPRKAIGMIDHHSRDELNRDRWYVVEKWLRKVPEGEKSGSASLLLAEAWVFYTQLRLPEMAGLIERAEPLLAHCDPEERGWLEGEISLVRAILAFWSGDSEGVLDFTAKAGEQLAPGFLLAQADRELYRGLGLQLAGRWKEAVEEFNRRLRDEPAAHPLFVTRRGTALGFVKLLAGRTAGVRNDSLLVRDVAGRNGFAYASGWAAYNQGCACFQRGRFEEARKHFSMVASQRHIFHPQGWLSGVAGLAITCEALGQQEEADAALDLLMTGARERAELGSLAVAESCRDRVMLWRGKGIGHRDLMTMDHPEIPAMIFFIEIPCITECRSLVAKGEPATLQIVLGRLSELREGLTRIHNTFQLIDVVTLQSLAYDRVGDGQRSLECLNHAVELALPGGWCRPFIEAGEAMRVLLGRIEPGKQNRGFLEHMIGSSTQPGSVGRRDQAPGKAPPQGLIEPLTNRELDVLELVVQRFQDKEMGERLSVSPLTIKAHLKHIYQKLGVSGRRNAARRAVELGLIPPP